MFGRDVPARGLKRSLPYNFDLKKNAVSSTDGLVLWARSLPRTSSKCHIVPHARNLISIPM